MSNGIINNKHRIDFWGGIECTINRVNNTYFDQLHLTGHYIREEDIKMIADLGIKTLRYPILWEKHESQYQHKIDWTFANQIFQKLEAYNITPIVGLLHHGSGPAYTDLLDDKFPELFADYASKVAQQFPEVRFYTPINEPLTTARFSGLYGLWYPHASNDVIFAKILLNELKGIVLAMKAIRKCNPTAQLVQTEDLSKTFSSSSLKYQADFENERRWLTYDLLCGKVQPGSVMWNYFMRLGIKEASVNFFMENATPPDIMGFNYYITSERYLYDDFKLHHLYTRGGNEIHEYNDVEAIRINYGNSFGLKVLLEEAWTRYKLPIALTEVHLNCGREDQLRWLNQIINICYDAIDAGVAIKALTFWSLLGAYGWKDLVTSEMMEYEPGAFDVRNGPPRPTAIASFIKSTINAGRFNHSILNQRGWWEEKDRFYKDNSCKTNPVKVFLPGRPIIIIGKTGTLGQAFARICYQRNLKYIFTDRETLNITNEKNIKTFLNAHVPWAVINTEGSLDVDDTQEKSNKCFDVNSTGLALLSDGCKQMNTAFVNISSDLVFNGQKVEPYNEPDAPGPFKFYNTSKTFVNMALLKRNATALIIRTSYLFGPWEKNNFVLSVLNSIANNKMVSVADDMIVSPTYIPHLVNAVLDLLIDNEAGVWHLSNEGLVSWKQFAMLIANKAGYDSQLIQGINGLELAQKATHLKDAMVNSSKGFLLPTLDNAINSFFGESISYQHRFKVLY
jgi:dTDP-4-dehydrorhamnose reductase